MSFVQKLSNDWAAAAVGGWNGGSTLYANMSVDEQEEVSAECTYDTEVMSWY